MGANPAPACANTAAFNPHAFEWIMQRPWIKAFFGSSESTAGPKSGSPGSREVAQHRLS